MLWDFYKLQWENPCNIRQERSSKRSKNIPWKIQSKQGIITTTRSKNELTTKTKTWISHRNRLPFRKHNSVTENYKATLNQQKIWRVHKADQIILQTYKSTSFNLQLYRQVYEMTQERSRRLRELNSTLYNCFEKKNTSSKHNYGHKISEVIQEFLKPELEIVQKMVECYQKKPNCFSLENKAEKHRSHELLWIKSNSYAKERRELQWCGYPTRFWNAILLKQILGAWNVATHRTINGRVKRLSGGLHPYE